MVALPSIYRLASVSAKKNDIKAATALPKPELITALALLFIFLKNTIVIIKSVH